MGAPDFFNVEQKESDIRHNHAKVHHFQDHLHLQTKKITTLVCTQTIGDFLIASNAKFKNESACAPQKTLICCADRNQLNGYIGVGT